jgi:hypothetical protein
MTKNPPRAFHSQSGIAIGPILFVLAMLALLGAVLAAGSGGFGIASVADRVSADTASQANLILSKISECNLKYGTNQNYDGYPSSDVQDGTPVSQIGCKGDENQGLLPNLWTGARPTTLPPPTQGFSPWTYINTNSTGQGGVAEGGRCIWIQPTEVNPAADEGIVAGLTKAASKFTHSPIFSPMAQVTYNPESGTQKFVVWITMPTGAPDINCIP